MAHYSQQLEPRKDVPFQPTRAQLPHSQFPTPFPQNLTNIHVAPKYHLQALHDEITIVI
jgi:hypothetical protein